MTEYLQPHPTDNPDDRERHFKCSPSTNNTPAHHHHRHKCNNTTPPQPLSLPTDHPPSYSSTSTPHAPRQRINFPPAPPLRSSAPGSKHQQHIGAPGHLLAMCAATQRAMMRASQAERACGRPMRCAQAHAASKPSADLPILGDLEYDLSLPERTSVDPLSLCHVVDVARRRERRPRIPGGLAGSLKRSSDMLGCQIPWHR
jgi:hypothetical protein